MAKDKKVIIKIGCIHIHTGSMIENQQELEDTHEQHLADSFASLERLVQLTKDMKKARSTTSDEKVFVIENVIKTIKHPEDLRKILNSLVNEDTLTLDELVSAEARSFVKDHGEKQRRKARPERSPSSSENGSPKGESKEAAQETGEL